MTSLTTLLLQREKVPFELELIDYIISLALPNPEVNINQQLEKKK